MNNPNPNQQGPNINLANTTEVKCTECGNMAFRPIFFFRKLSMLVSPDGKDHLIPLDSLECTKCGHINDEFNPIKNLDSLKQNEKSE